MITVDVAGRGEGVIPGHELERMSRRMMDNLKVGEKIMVFVVNHRGPEGKAE